MVAHLLGIRLLRVRASVTIAPAAPAVEQRSSRVPRESRAPAIGRGLAAAARSIDEGEAILAAARADGPVALRSGRGRSAIG